MKLLAPLAPLLVIGCAEVQDAGVVGGVSFWNEIVPISIDSAAQETAQALNYSAPALGAASFGVTLLTFGTLGLFEPGYQTENNQTGNNQKESSCRTPEGPIETEYSEEIRLRREEVERGKSYPMKW